MLLLSGNSQGTPELWSARATVRAEAGEVLAALTDPELIAAWAPIGFELDDPEAPPLRSGSHERVCGSIAGVKAHFDVDVTCAELGRLELIADGPLGFDVRYRFRQQGCRVVVEASVGLRSGGGLTGQILRRAAAALLNAGALDRALERLGEALRGSVEPALAAA